MLLFIFIFLFSDATYTKWYLNHHPAMILSIDKEEVPIKVEGDIVSIPLQQHQQTKFDFQIREWNRRVKLIWHTKEKLHVGDRWQFTVKLKRIHGLHNPGGFDYEAWALQHGLYATGTVVGNASKKASHHWYVHPVDQIRQAIYLRLQECLPHSSLAHWLIALAVGEHANIPQEQWQVLRRTGTNHLMAIGGLHIGMVAGFGYLLMSWCWRRSAKWTLIKPAQEVGIVAALLMAWVYGALSGFAIPAQRACLMLSVWVFAKLSRRQLNPWVVWLVAMTVVLVVNPLSMLSESFWLSFGTIAIIILGGGVFFIKDTGSLPKARRDDSVTNVGWHAVLFARNLPNKLNNLWQKHGRLQWIIGFGLLPLSLLFFQEWSFTSFLANSIAIPWLCFLILPFCLLGTLLLFIIPPLGKILLFIADKSLHGLWSVMTYLSKTEFAVWSQAMPNSWIFMLCIVGVLLLITPIKFPARWLAIIFLAPLMFYKPPLLAAKQAKVTVLDVGQGLSVVVQTRHHALLFDAGPPMQNVIVSFLRTAFIKQLDMMVISHGDADHIGGASDVLQNIPVKSIRTSVPEKFNSSSFAALCLAGQRWEWDGVLFQFIYPYPDTLQLGNDSSCVLRVDAGDSSVIIPGDIERFAEEVLVTRLPQLLSATMLVAAHHGSQTSSTEDFVERVYPRYVFYSTGYHNRYHFPHAPVVARYQQFGVVEYDTARVGAITLNLK